VIYSYEVGGSMFTGTNDKPFIEDSSAKAYGRSFPKGRSVIIRIRPGNPETSAMLDLDQKMLDLDQKTESR
jgi:hypothetical protein